MNDIDGRLDSIESRLADINDRVTRERAEFTRKLEQWVTAEYVRLSNLASIAKDIGHPAAEYLEAAAAACRLAAEKGGAA